MNPDSYGSNTYSDSYNADESYPNNEAYRLSIGCSIQPIKFHFITASYDQNPKVELQISVMPNASFFINITTDWPIMGGVLTVTNQNADLSFILNSNLGRAWRRVTKHKAETRLDQVQSETYLDSVSIIFPRQASNSITNQFVVTLEGHNFDTISEFVEIKRFTKPVIINTL